MLAKKVNGMKMQEAMDATNLSKHILYKGVSRGWINLKMQRRKARSLISKEKAISILQMHKDGWKPSEIAKAIGFSRENVKNVIQGTSNVEAYREFYENANKKLGRHNESKEDGATEMDQGRLSRN